MCFVHLLQNLWCPPKFYPASSTNVLGKFYDPSSFSGFFFYVIQKNYFYKTAMHNLQNVLKEI